MMQEEAKIRGPEFSPWSHQSEAIEKILAYAKQHPSGRLLIVCPPGGGKTLVAARILVALAVERSERGLVVAHRREMVEHHYKHLLRCDVAPDMLGILMGKDPRTRPTAPIQIASVDTLNRRNKPPAAILVTDEAHRDASRCRRLLRQLYPDAFRLGFTATPTRLGSRGLKDDFDEMFVISSVSELILAGRLSAPKVFTVPENLLPDVKSVRIRAGEFEPEGLARAANRRSLVGGIVEHWIRIARGRRTVVFATSIAHSKHIVSRFEVAGIQAAHLDQGTPIAERVKVLADLEAGIIRVVSCVNILSEGWDCPPCKCVVLARPTKSLNLHIQQGSRGMRPWEAVVPLILDHAGNMLRHGLPQMDHEWTLEGDRCASDDPPVKVCPECMAVVATGLRECPECGHLFERTPAVLDETDGVLVEFKMTPKDKEKEMSRLRDFARARGFADAERWARQVFEAKYSEPARI